MTYIIQDEMHRVTEIIDLYYDIVNKEEKDKVPSRLTEFGIDEEKFKKVELKPINKFIETFKAKSPYGEDEKVKIYFKDIDGNVNRKSLASMMLGNKGIEELEVFREEVLQMEEESIRKSIAQNIATELEDDMETIGWKLLIDTIERVAYLEKQAITIEAKWHIILILDHVKEHLLKLIDVILESQSAYEVASKHIVKLKEKFVKELKDKLGDNPKYISESFGIDIKIIEGMKVYPSIVAYGSGRLKVHANEGDGIIFFGCYFNYITEIARKNSQEKLEIVNIMKILGESSKFEIIKLLKKKPMYGIEIAERLGITAPTVSHHMNNLIIYKLVRLEKIENKFCYVLDKEKIESVLGELKTQLLD